jgi:hypothetical protein
LTLFLPWTAGERLEVEARQRAVSPQELAALVLLYWLQEAVQGPRLDTGPREGQTAVREAATDLLEALRPFAALTPPSLRGTQPDYPISQEWIERARAAIDKAEGR